MTDNDATSSINEWRLATRDSGFLKRHLIPEDKTLWPFDQFPAFLAAREELIRDRLRSLFDFSGDEANLPVK